ncbi:MAG: hypothetical protein NT123_13130 [Proteobacteria bacterium]|nr:hypothetical protein [Pseudomonadota bacterium]
MFKFILTILLAIVCGNAAAEWIKLTELEAGSVYVDPASVLRDGDVVKLGSLYDLKSAIVSMTNGKPYASQKLQSEYDCRGEKWRMLHFSWHSGKMGEGKMVEYLADAYAWAPVPPGSGVQILWDFACGKN